MVAISVLSLAVTAPMIIAQKGIASAVYARDQITAFYLAQEAVEYIRNIRDTNRIQSAPGGWLSSLTPCIDDGAGQRCYIDARYPDFTNVNAVTTCTTTVVNGALTCANRLSLDSLNLYGYGSGLGWKPSIFTRTVYLDRRASAKEAQLSVNVTWSTNLFGPNNYRSFTIKEYIMNF
jgi:hypothetical protein